MTKYNDQVSLVQNRNHVSFVNGQWQIFLPLSQNFSFCFKKILFRWSQNYEWLPNFGNEGKLRVWGLNFNLKFLDNNSQNQPIVCPGNTSNYGFQFNPACFLTGQNDKQNSMAKILFSKQKLNNYSTSTPICLSICQCILLFLKALVKFLCSRYFSVSPQ